MATAALYKWLERKAWKKADAVKALLPAAELLPHGAVGQAL